MSTLAQAMPGLLPDGAESLHELIDLSSVFCGIHLKAISQEVPSNFMRNMYSEILLFEYIIHLQVTDELSHWYALSLIPTFLSDIVCWQE